MKNMTKKSKIIFMLLFIFIIAGITVIAQIGFNFDMRYTESEQVSLSIGNDFDIADIKAITDEVFPTQRVMLQKVEMYEDTVAITTTTISDEDKTELIEKVNEKYGISLSSEDITIQEIPHTRGRDIIKPYIAPFCIAIAITLVYLAIRYHKLTVWKVLLETCGIIILTQVLLFCLIAVTRIPIGMFTIPMMLIVYMITMMHITSKFENNLSEIKLKEENNRKK